MNFLKSAFTTSEAAPYRVVQTLEKGIEERIYPAQKWVASEILSEPKTMDNIKTERFWSLFGYITGKNDKEQKIAMTVPVSTKVEPAPDNKTSYQMGFYVPKQFQENTPVPSDENVRIVERDLHVFVITFSGFAKEADYDKKLEELISVLKAANITLPLYPDEQEPIHYCVGYDSPAKLINRRNEVWLRAEL